MQPRYATLHITDQALKDALIKLKENGTPYVGLFLVKPDDVPRETASNEGEHGNSSGHQWAVPEVPGLRGRLQLSVWRDASYSALFPCPASLSPPSARMRACALPLQNFNDVSKMHSVGTFAQLQQVRPLGTSAAQQHVLGTMLQPTPAVGPRLPVRSRGHSLCSRFNVLRIRFAAPRQHLAVQWWMQGCTVPCGITVTERGRAVRCTLRAAHRTLLVACCVLRVAQMTPSEDGLHVVLRGHRRISLEHVVSTEPYLVQTNKPNPPNAPQIVVP
jgi:hypothetical protein